MREDEVPRDPGFLEGFQRGTYALDASGRYTLVPTPGWQAETAVTTVALQEQDRLLRRYWELARAGRRSPLAYHMARRQMTPKLLARHMGLARLRVAWHLRPRGFRRMPLELALCYCACLDLPIQELLQVPDVPGTFL
ncbi:MAG: hypothetical protein HY900_03205 [Deltaproteobacteria bacterium]|nr:hypothetical protein [Deltaproteobacteria bacterium]